MDLRYRILWFDDQPELVDGVEKFVRANLDAIGLSLDVTWVKDFDAAVLDPIIAKLRISCPYDLILVDYDLGKIKGDKLLKRLRLNSNGEMVFYSAAKVKELRSLLLEQNVDGIFCFHRDQRLGSEIFAIVESTIRRFFHPNYMRGLVVGSVSDLESRFSEAILAIMKLGQMPSEAEIRETILRGAKEHLTQQLTDLEKNGANIPIERLVGKANLHAKLEVLLHLLKTNGGRIATSSMDVLSKFADEINEPRIEFAHAQTVEHEGFPVFKARNGKIWTQKEMKALIRAIRIHKNAAGSLKDIADE